MSLAMKSRQNATDLQQLTQQHGFRST